MLAVAVHSLRLEPQRCRGRGEHGGRLDRRSPLRPVLDVPRLLPPARVRRHPLAGEREPEEVPDRVPDRYGLEGVPTVVYYVGENVWCMYYVYYG